MLSSDLSIPVSKNRHERRRIKALRGKGLSDDDIQTAPCRGPRHHLDRRADQLAELGTRGSPDDLLTTPAVAEWLGVSTQWLEIGRSKGYGPRFVRLSTRRVRYRRSDVLDWLGTRTCASTAEYAARANG